MYGLMTRPLCCRHQLLKDHSFAGTASGPIILYYIILYYITVFQNSLCTPELVMGHLFKTQPNPTQNFCTQPNPQKSPPDPTQPIIDTWYGILGYTENFIQQQTVTRHRQVHSQWQSSHRVCKPVVIPIVMCERAFIIQLRSFSSQQSAK